MATDQKNLYELFEAATDLPPEERRSYLDDACAGHPEMRRDLEALLTRDASESLFLETPAVVQFVESDDRSGVVSSRDIPQPASIGPFRILRLLAEGGMAFVYLAEQENPQRRVALKVIKPGLASEQAIHRLEHEAVILARLQHPSIAQVYQAGVAEFGLGRQPFFAMELVDGPSLVRYAEREGLDTRDRLKLFQVVCEAVHHAHQRGVVHRDLKPDNILVDNAGRPKVLDFGVARITDADIVRAPVHTMTGQFVGTIPYMSPEQVSGDSASVDARSDVYALGLICYRLLTGRLPYELSDKLIHEAVRVIRNDEPTPISSIDRIFRGDLETIVHKALEKDRERRYQTASDLGTDIGRYLHHEAIVARPASAAYQVRKFARRHAALVSALVVVLLALSAGVTAATWGFLQADRQRDHAESNLQRALQAEELAQTRLQETEAARAEETRLRVLAEQRFKDADDARASEREKTAKALASIQDRIQEALAGQPALEASTYHMLGRGLRELGQFDSAAPFLVAAAEIRREHLGNHDEETLESLAALANLRADQAFGNSGETPEERERLRELHDEAIRLFREVYESSVRSLGPEDRRTVTRRIDLATLLPAEEAEPILRDILAMLRRTVGPSDPQTLTVQSNLAYSLRSLGRHREAVAEYRELIADREKIYPAGHLELAQSLGNMALCLEAIGDFSGAVDTMRRSLSGHRQAHGDEDRRVLMTWQALADLLRRAGRRAKEDGNEAAASEFLEEASETYTTVLALRRSVLGSRHGNTLVTINMLGALKHDQGEYVASEALFRELIASAEAALPQDHWHRSYFKSNFANLLIDMERFEEAERLLLTAYPHLLKHEGSDLMHTTRAAERLVTLYERWGRSDQAAEWRTKVSAEE